jgi:CRP-like cAMP-binding protein
MDALAAAAPMKTYSSGALIYTPHQPLEALFILKRGRIRIFRISSDGRALTTAIITPGTIFGEMVIVGQRMHDSFAEALDEAVVCVMNQHDVRRLLLSAPGSPPGSPRPWDAGSASSSSVSPMRSSKACRNASRAPSP